MTLINSIINRWIQEGKENPEGLWEAAAKELPWFRTWDRVFEWDFPTFRWFVGAQTNLAYNALDHHVNNGRGGHTALVYVNERGERRLFTYANLLYEVKRLAAALRGMGISKGDRVTIYMPTCPEAIMLMLATVRIGAIHTHGGYQVHISSMGRWCFGLEPKDVWWSTSDIGWIVGHSYIVYVPLIAGCTTVAFEGALDHPRSESNWQMLVEEFGVTGIFTSPTAVRMLMRYGDGPLGKVDHSRLKRVFCAGEVLNAPAWDWLQNTILKNRTPVIDHMWQTETGGPVFGNPYGLMRRVLKAVILNQEPGDITTIEDESSVEEARQAWQQMRDEMAAIN